MEINRKKINDLRSFQANGGLDQLAEYCIDVRTDLDLATEKIIAQIQEQRDEVIKAIEEFERDCAKELGKGYGEAGELLTNYKSL